MEEDMADEEMKTEVEEMQGEDADGDAGVAAESEEAAKTEEELEQELKETQISIPRYAPHTVPGWNREQMRERWMWHLRIFPIDQEDCRNCILDAATKISQEAWYYVPKRKNGQGAAEMCMVSNNEATAVMARVLRMPFYHRYVTLEVTRRGRTEGLENPDSADTPYNTVEETATIVLDSTKCEKIKNTATSRGNQKRRSLWVRYLSENTSPEILRVLFPLSQSTQVQTHDNLRIGLVEAHSKTDVLIFMKAYLTVVINGTHILALQNKEPGENESEMKAELEKTVTAVDELEEAPAEVADRTSQRKDDKTQTSRVLKRTLHQQQRMVDGRRKDQSGNKRGRGGEPPAKRGGGAGLWGDARFDGRRSGGSGGGRFGGALGYGGGGGGGGGFPVRGGRGGFAGDMAAEMMMMQAQLNQTIQNQLMMLNPGSRGGGGGGGGGYGGGRFGGGGGGGGGGSGGGRRGGRGGGGRGGRGGGGRKGFGGGW